MNEFFKMLFGNSGLPGPQPAPSPVSPPMVMAEALDPNSDEAWNMRMRQLLDNPTAPHTVWPGMSPQMGGEQLAPITPQNDNGQWPPVQQTSGKDQSRMGLDTSGLAAFLNDPKNKRWPLDAMEGVPETPGQLRAPPHFIDPSFIGPLQQPRLWGGETRTPRAQSAPPVGGLTQEDLIRMLFEGARRI